MTLSSSSHTQSSMRYGTKSALRPASDKYLVFIHFELALVRDLIKIVSWETLFTVHASL
jgi:hypothetical protein